MGLARHVQPEGEESVRLERAVPGGPDEQTLCELFVSLAHHRRLGTSAPFFVELKVSGAFCMHPLAVHLKGI